MSSKTEQILQAVLALLETLPNAKVERNMAVPEKIPAGGLILLRDGNPGDPDTALGGLGGAYYSHDIEVDVYVEEGGAAARDTVFDTLLRKFGNVLEADPTIGGLTFGMTYGRPEIDMARAYGPSLWIERHAAALAREHLRRQVVRTINR